MGKAKDAGTKGLAKQVTQLVGEVARKLGLHSSFRQNVALAVLIGGGGGVALWNYKKHKSEAERVASIPVAAAAPSERRGQPVAERVAVDKRFFQRLVLIVKVCVPSWKTKEFVLVILYTVLLVSRTLLSVTIADLAGENAEMLVARDFQGLYRGVKKFAIITIPAAAVNSGLKYVTNMLALLFRKRLSFHVNQNYLKGQNFYKATNLGGVSRIDNADQRVTSDIEKFSTAFCELYGTVFKPTLDVILFTSKISAITGWQGPLLMYSYFILSGVLKKAVMPPLGKLTAKESEMEGSYRTAHQRLISNAEEIAFYDGGQTEKTILNTLFQNLFKHGSYISYLRTLMGVFDGLLVKYWASIVGYGVMASPILIAQYITKKPIKDANALTGDYIRNTSYLMALAAAVGQIVLIGNKITVLSGYSSRVSELLEKVKILDKVGNQPFVVRSDEELAPATAPTVDGAAAEEAAAETEKETKKEEPAADATEFLREWRKKRDAQRAVAAVSASPPPRRPAGARGGTIITGELIRFENVDIVTPDGQLLVRNLSFEVPPGRNVMVTGPNGSGKSSIFRVIGELWPLQCGTLVKPRKEDFIFVPQKPYQVLGSLRDQIIYPHSHAKMLQLGITDDDLFSLLDVVDPTRIIRSTWALDDVKDWINTFSGGQKQRVAMARVFYHKPTYAFLDEATSAVSDEIEGKMYEACKRLGITLFTVSHRTQLQKYHDYTLKLLGNGDYEFKQRRRLPEPLGGKV